MNDIWPLILSDLLSAIRLSRVSKQMLSLMANTIKRCMLDPSYYDLLSIGIKQCRVYKVKLSPERDHFGGPGYRKQVDETYVWARNIFDEGLYFKRYAYYVYMYASEPTIVINNNIFSVDKAFKIYRYFMVDKHKDEDPPSPFCRDNQLKAITIDRHQSSDVLQLYKDWKTTPIVYKI